MDVNKIVLSRYLLLDFERYSSDNVSLLDSLHEMGCISSDLIPQPLGGDLADLLQDELIILEIAAQLRVVFLDELLGSFLNCLCSDAALATSYKRNIFGYHL